MMIKSAFIWYDSTFLKSLYLLNLFLISLIYETKYLWLLIPIYSFKLESSSDRKDETAMGSFTSSSLHVNTLCFRFWNQTNSLLAPNSNGLQSDWHPWRSTSELFYPCLLPKSPPMPLIGPLSNLIFIDSSFMIFILFLPFLGTWQDSL